MMKLRIVVSLILVGVVTSSLAMAQLSPEKDDALPFVKTAADVAGNVQQQSLEGFIAIYVEEQKWADIAKDGDLGPFLKLKEASPKAGRSAVCFFNEAKDTATCVYFDGNSPFGVTAVKAANGGPIQANDIAAAYKPVSKDTLKKGEHNWQFTKVPGINSDQGVALTAYQISGPNPLQKF